MVECDWSPADHVYVQAAEEFGSAFLAIVESKEECQVVLSEPKALQLCRQLLEPFGYELEVQG